MPTFDKDTKLVWMDLEFTGLNPETNRITEIACIITDINLEIIAEKESIVINQKEELFDKENLFIYETFIKTGFVEKVTNSKYTEERAEDEMLEFLKKHVEYKSAPLCGSSVYMDRIFIMKYMKKLDDFLYYKLLDMSSFKLAKRLWYPDIAEYEKVDSHRALDDIRDSINQCKHYRKYLFSTNQL